MGVWDIISGIANVASSGAKVYSSYSQAEAAEEQQDLQEQEMRRQQRLAQANAKREARVRQARIYAGQGQAGISSSMATSGIIGVSTTLASGLDDLQQRTDLNIEGTKIAEQNTKTQAYAGMALGAASFASEANEINFADWKI